MNKGAWWPVAIVGVLAVTVLANVVLLIEADGKGAAVVEPDYYRRALVWDSTRAAEVRSDSLGWRAEAAFGPLGADGRAELRVRLLDRDGAAVTGARVRVSALHNTYADRPVEAALTALAGGAYGARLPMIHAGLWALRIAADRGPDHFGAELRRELGGASR